MTIADQGANVPAIFQFQAHQVRTVLRDGIIWFVAADVCTALGYVNPSKAVADHLDEDERSHEQLDRSRMGSKAVIINESGLYALVLRSRKPEARKFAKWVTAEVLPAIRKSGHYGHTPRHGDLFDSDYFTEAYRHAAPYFEQFWKLSQAGEELRRVDAERMDRLVDGMLASRLMTGRWILTFDSNGESRLRRMANEDQVLTSKEFAERISDPSAVPSHLLPDIAEAVMQRLMVCLPKN